MANVVSIQIVVDNAQAQAAMGATMAALQGTGAAAEAAGQQIGTASAKTSESLGQVSTSAGTLAEQMRKAGLSGVVAQQQLTGASAMAEEMMRRSASASGEMQQMAANMAAAMTRGAVETDRLAASQVMVSGAIRQTSASFTGLAGAVSGGAAALQTFGSRHAPVIVANNQLTGSMRQTSNATTSTATAFTQFGTVGTAFQGTLNQVSSASTQAGGAIGGIGAHSTTSLDGVRLLSQELGLRLPRALETLISRIPAVTSLISGMISVFAAIAIAEVVFRAGEAVYQLYERWFDVTKAVKEYQIKAAEAAQTELFDTASMETANELLAETTKRVDVLNAKKSQSMAEMHGGGALQWLNYAGDANPDQLVSRQRTFFTPDDDKDLAATMALQAIAQKQVADVSHKDYTQRMQDQAAYDAAVAGSANKAAVQHQAAIAAAQAELTYTKEREYALTHISELNTKADPDKYPVAKQYHADVNAGENDYALAVKKADLDLAAASLAESRQERDQRIAMQNEAINAMLDGEARYTAQRSQAIDAINRKVADGNLTAQTGTAEVAAIRQKFDAEQVDRLNKQFELVQKTRRAASEAGLTGASKIVADHNRRINEINTDGNIMPETASGLREDAAIEADQKLKALEDDYSDHVREEVQRRTEATLTGFAKIEAAHQVQIDQVKKNYQKTFGGTDVPASAQAIGAQGRDTELSGIDADAATERTKLIDQIQQQTLQADKETAQAERRVRAEGLAGWVQDYRSSLAEIQAANAEQQSKIAAAQQKTGNDPVTNSLFEQQKVDADRAANAQIVELNQQMQHQLASTLEDAFTNPVAYIQKKMKDMFFQILADWIMQSEGFKSVFGSTIGSVRPGGSPSHAGGLTGALTQSMGLSPTGGATGVPAAANAQQMATGSTNSGASPIAAAESASGTVQQMYAVAGSDSTQSAGSTPSSISSALSLTRTGAPDYQMLAQPSWTGDGQSSAAPASLQAASSRDYDFTSPTPVAVDPDSAWNDASQVSSSAVGGPGNLMHGFSTENGAGITPANVATVGMGVYGGAKGVVSSFESGKASGIETGAISGASVGASIGMLAGPEGALIGGAAGAVGGAAAGLVGWASGEGGRTQGQKYYRSTIFPQMEAVEAAYDGGNAGDAVSAISQANTIAAQGFDYLRRTAGASTAAWTRDTYITKEQTKVTSDINAMARGGHDNLRASAAQFHDGGVISGFGSMGTSGNEGYIHAMMGETVISRAASLQHAPLLQAIGTGASATDIAGAYLRSSGGGPSSGGNSTHFHDHDYHINAVDGKSFATMLRSGGAKVAYQEINHYTTQYAGDGG